MLCRGNLICLPFAGDPQIDLDDIAIRVLLWTQRRCEASKPKSVDDRMNIHMRDYCSLRYTLFSFARVTG